MVQADRDLTAMEMAFTLPDQTESEGTMRMEGDPAALADDAAAANPSAIVDAAAIKHNRNAVKNPRPKMRKKPVKSPTQRPPTVKTVTKARPSVGGRGRVVDDVGGGTRMARPQLRRKFR